MKVALWRATRIKALPRDAVMARKMLKAAKNPFTPADNVVMPARVSSLVKFPSPVMFAIVLWRLENLSRCEDRCYLTKSLGQLAGLTSD